MSDKKQRAKGFIIGVIVGGAVGAIGALLTAPKSGRELRKDIADQVEAVSDKTQQIAGIVGSRTSEWASKAKSTATGVVSEVKSWRLVKETPTEAAAALEETEAQ